MPWRAPGPCSWRPLGGRPGTRISPLGLGNPLWRHHALGLRTLFPAARLMMGCAIQPPPCAPSARSRASCGKDRPQPTLSREVGRPCGRAAGPRRPQLGPALLVRHEDLLDPAEASSRALGRTWAPQVVSTAPFSGRCCAASAGRRPARSGRWRGPGATGGSGGGRTPGLCPGAAAGLSRAGRRRTRSSLAREEMAS